jgi:hypothetical protein
LSLRREDVAHQPGRAQGQRSALGASHIRIAGKRANGPFRITPCSAIQPVSPKQAILTIPFVNAGAAHIRSGERHRAITVPADLRVSARPGSAGPANNGAVKQAALRGEGFGAEAMMQM